MSEMPNEINLCRSIKTTHFQTTVSIDFAVAVDKLVPKSIWADITIVRGGISRGGASLIHR